MTSRVDVSSLLRLTDWRAYLLFALFTLTNGVNALATASSVRSPAVAVVSWVVVTVAAALLLVPAPDPYPARLAVLVVVLTTLAVSATWNVVDDVRPGWSAWFWGAASIVLLFLALRGRIGAAWIGMGLMIALALAWALSVGHDPWAGLAFVVRHAAMVLVGTFFAIYLRNTAEAIQRLQEAELQRARVQEGARAATDEQRARLERLRDLAGPALELLASDAPLRDSNRRDFGLLEATLRDWMRAEGLASEPVLAAARAARARGVDVTLLDDSGDHPPDAALRTVLDDAVVGALERQAEGDIVVRLLPPGRDVAATIRGSDGSRTVRVDVGAPSAVATSGSDTD